MTRGIPARAPVWLWFQDETRFGRISDRRRGWAPWPNRPTVGHQVIREYLDVLAAVRPGHGHLCPLIMPWVDAETMSVFLAHIARQQESAHGVMLLDGAGWHRANELRVPHNLRLLFLPPYSPELNPVEHLWDHLRENYIGNRTFDSLDQVETFLSAALAELIPQTDLIRSLTSFEWLNTLYLTAN